MSRRRPAWFAALALVAAAIAVAIATSVLGPEPRPARRSGPCVVTDDLVNECRPWFGASVSGYTEVGSDARSQFEHLEQRVGRRLDIIHTYNPAGSILLRQEQSYLQVRPDLIPFVNWKPDAVWRNAAGDHPVVNARIDTAADNIKTIAPRKMFLALHHEPENDVSVATAACTAKGVKMKGGAGSTEDYRAMWANVRRRFEARGVTNVVWVMNYMNYPPWDCLVNDLWPGNDAVDWVTFEAYWSRQLPTWSRTVGRFYEHLEKNSNATHDYKSKPWGIAEFGAWQASPRDVLRFYASARVAIADGRYPRLKMYLAFDSPGEEGYQDLRVGYGLEGIFDPSEQKAFNDVANLPQLSGSDQR
jgi:hypothetical protein